DQTNAAWVLKQEGSTTPIPQIDLYFNYKVDAAELKSKLKIMEGDKSLPFNLLTAGKDSKITLQLPDLKAVDKDLILHLILAKGVKPEGGQTGLKEELRQRFVVPSRFVLTINGVSSEHDGTTGRVLVRTSQPVTESGLKSFISLDP